MLINNGGIMKAIFISIKPIYLNQIHHQLKDHEFRSFIPKKDFDTLFVYESSPTCQLRYLITLNDIVEYPNQIPETGKGNKSFNNGEKFGNKQIKYAYQIKEVYELDKPISLTELRNDYAFCPPQGFAYDEKYPKLSETIMKSDKKLLWKK